MMLGDRSVRAVSEGVEWARFEAEEERHERRWKGDSTVRRRGHGIGRGVSGSAQTRLGQEFGVFAMHCDTAG